MSVSNISHFTNKDLHYTTLFLHFCYSLSPLVISGPGSGNINSPDDFEQFIQRSDNGGGPYYCQLCSYAQTQFSVVKNHVESKHFPNTFSYQCQQCDTVLGTNTALYRHVQRVHKNQ